MRVSDMTKLAAQAEEAAFDGVYVVEAWRSAPACLAAIALATERVTIGPYVLNAHARSPWITGMAAIDLDEISGGRLLMGVGSGNKITNERYQGIPVVKPLAKMRDYVTLLKLITRAQPGEMVEYSGAMHSMSEWRQQVKPLRKTIPIYLAATSPKMSQLAAEVADGIALGTLISPEFIARVGRACRQKAGPSFGVIATAFLAVNSDREKARAAARRAVVNLYAGKPHPHYDSLLRQQGFETVADAIIKHVADGNLGAADAAVTDQAVDDLTIAGTPDECLRRFEDYAAVVDELILMNVGAMHFQKAGEGGGLDRETLLSTFQPLFDLGRRYAARLSATTA
jgi:alkanesulfonate monooxygenase SsuD/methylene tetrahydromethanopterin reductase-like flavin-dependent oxidoreductase (luciferase family)